MLSLFFVVIVSVVFFVFSSFFLLPSIFLSFLPNMQLLVHTACIVRHNLDPCDAFY